MVDRCYLGERKECRGIKIWRRSSEPSGPSETEKNPHVSSDLSNDSNSDPTVMPTVDNQSSEKILENYAQNKAPDDTDDADDTFQVSQAHKGQEMPAPSQSLGQLIEGSSATIVEEQPKTPDSIYRLGRSDIWVCHNCNQKGDRWFMIKHPEYCRRKLKPNS